MWGGMVMELALILESIAGIGKILQVTKATIEKLKPGVFGSKNVAEVKQDLTDKIHDLEKSLEHIGQSARFAEAYLEAHENIAELLSQCVRAEEFFKDHMRSLDNLISPDFSSQWQLAQLLWQAIRSNSDTPKRTLMDRQEWYDARDREQIGTKLKDFMSAFERGSGGLEAQRAGGVLSELQNMHRSLEDVNTALRDTLYRKILASLKDLSPGVHEQGRNR
jgi:hypothetical protein